MKIDFFKKHWKLLVIIFSAIISALGLIFGEHGLLYLKNRRIELKEYTQKIDKIAQDKLKLEQEIEQLKTDKDYLKREISKEMNMLGKNEVKYVFKDNENVTESRPSSDVIDEKLGDVYELIKKKKIKEARVKLEEIKELTGYGTSFDYLDYPSSIIHGIKTADALINDAEGYFNDFPRMDGVITETDYGPSSGYFVVKGADGEKSFIWEADLITVDETSIKLPPNHKDSGEYRDPWIGCKVTVYYDNFLSTGSGSEKAVKIIVHGSSPE